MSTVWPFPPRAELIEAIEWLTDVLPAYSGEDRAPLRSAPLRALSFNHYLGLAAQNAAREAAQGDGVFLVPDWTALVREDASTGAPSSLEDGAAIIWRSATDYEQITITGGIYGPVTAPALAAKVMPLLTCRASDALSISRAAGGPAEAQITMQTTEGGTTADASLYPARYGIPFVNERIVVGASTSREGVAWENDTTDGGIALPVDVRASSYAERPAGLGWYRKASEFAPLRAFLYYLAGRYRGFWLPSWADDMPGAELTTDGLFVPVFDDNEQAVAIEVDGVLYPRLVESAIEGAGGVFLTLDEDPPAGTIGRTMYLRLMRLNADRLEVRHFAPGRVFVSTACVKIPIEYAALQADNGEVLITEAGDILRVD